MRDIFLKTTRPAALCLVLLGTVAGCTTSRQLHHSTLAAGQTVSDMECKMVLNNLAMYHAQAGLLPDISQFISGEISVNDTLGLGNSSLTYSWSPWAWGVGMNASRKVQESWTISPQTDSTVLARLEKLYTAFEQGYVSNPANHPGITFSHLPPIDDSLAGNYGNTFVSVNKSGRGELTQMVLHTLAIMNPPKISRGKAGEMKAMAMPEGEAGPQPIFIQ